MNVFDELADNTFVNQMLEKDESKLSTIDPVTQLNSMDVRKDVPMKLEQREFIGPFKIVEGIDVRVEFKSYKE